MKILSICIPTYNRCNYLLDLLHNLNQNLDSNQRKNIEICISDNFSSDDTVVSVQKFIETHDIDVILNVNSQNYGPDYNYIEVIKLATGKYCWYISSDDLVVQDINIYINKIFESNFDVLLFDRYLCDKDMHIVSTQSWCSFKSDEKLLFNSDNEIIKYFDSCLSLGGVFSFISCIVFKREKWVKFPFINDIIGTNYSHVYFLLKILLDYPSKLYYIKKPLILCRGNNDSFSNNNEFDRFYLDVTGYLKISDLLLNNLNDEKGIHLLKIITREHNYLKLLKYICIKNIGFKNKNYIKDIITVGYNKRFVYFCLLICNIRFIIILFIKFKRYLNFSCR